MVENYFITGKHVQAILNILWNVLLDSRRMIRLDMDVDGGVSGFSVGFVSAICEIQSDIQEVDYFLISGDFLQ